MILVLHEINYAAFYSDYICAFVDGKIAKFGTVEEVMTKENLARIYKVDFEIMRIQGKPLSIYYLLAEKSTAPMGWRIEDNIHFYTEKEINP